MAKKKDSGVPGGLPPPPPPPTRKPSPFGPPQRAPQGFLFSGQYFQTVFRSFVELAASYGYALDAAKVHTLINNSISVSEFGQRLQAMERVNTNKVVFDQFEATLRQLKLSNKFDLKDRLAFVLNESPKEFYQVWDEAATRGAAANAGFAIENRVRRGQNADTVLGTRDIARIQSAAGIEGPQAGNLDLKMAKDFQELYTMAQKTLPLSRWGGYGIKKSDLETLQFGGPNQGAIAKRVDQILANEKAGQQATAAPSFTPGTGGPQERGLKGLAGTPTR